MNTETHFARRPAWDVWRFWPIAAAFVLGWSLVVRALWPHWSLNAQYQYGELVPFLCAALFFLRWQDRPATQAASRPGALATAIGIFCGAMVLALVPLVVESNADWRLPGAMGAALAVAMTLGAIYLAGGKAWLWHFAFPVCFFLVAVPWPSLLEITLMNSLMQHNASLCVEALQWSGYEAARQGNLIALPTGVLEVEQACSGVRSLQSGLMVSLLFGEYFRLGLAGRLLLVAISFGAALVGNALRTITLSVVASSSGTHAVEAWHDPAGLTILLGTMAVTAAVGWWLKGKPKQPQTSAAPVDWADFAKQVLPLRRGAFVLCAIWLLAIAGTQAWYGAHDTGKRDILNDWALQRATPSKTIKEVEIPKVTLNALLQPDTAFSESWMDKDGLRWRTFFFRWKPGRSATELAMTVHDPKVCLGAMGMTLEESYGVQIFEAGGFRIPFRKFLFRDRQFPLYIFHAVVADDTGDPGAPKEERNAPDATDYTATNRLQAVLSGKRNRGLRLLEIGVWGARSLPEAEQRLQALLDERITTASQATSKDR